MSKKQNGVGRIHRPFRFIDGDALRKCFANKRIMLLGDSTMGDYLVILLTKMGNNVTIFEDYLVQTTKSSRQHLPYLALNVTNDIGLTVEHFGGRRNVTVKSTVLNMTLQFRFTGSYNMPVAIIYARISRAYLRSSLRSSIWLVYGIVLCL
jgi:hypothetical protein